MERSRTGRGVVLLAMAGLTLGLGATSAPRQHVQALVLGKGDALRAAIAQHGGSVTDELSVVDGAVAMVPADELAALDAESGIDVIADRSVTFEATLPGTSYDPVTQAGSMYSTAQMTGAPSYWAAGYTGAGVDVALVDTGVQPSAFFGSRLVAGTDVSGVGNSLSDGLGHGTHLAGIIAGAQGTPADPQSFTGIAPGARIVSVKVADSAGGTSLVKVLQGLDWVHANKTTGGRNIKVVNLSFGVAAMSSYVLDPLATAVERLWLGGVAVVASTGNIGPGYGLLAPAYDPHVIAVGALDSMGTLDVSDDAVASFSAGAVTTSQRRPDVVAPGRSIQSLLASGSAAATLAPASSKIGTTYVVGSGTSQATAVVSGAVALMYQERPSATPTTQKARITSNTSKVDDADARNVGSGRLNLSKVRGSNVSASASYTPATASTTNVDVNADSALRANGPQGSQWLGSQWPGSQWLGSYWLGSYWLGSLWMGSTWR